MGFLGTGNESYLYLGGIKVNEEIPLTDSVSILPLTQRLDINTIPKTLESEVDFGIVIIFARTLSAHLKIIAGGPEEVAITSWNSQWYLILLSAIFKTEISWNIQSTHPTDLVSEESILGVTNYHLRGLHSNVHEVTCEEAEWLKKYFAHAKNLLDNNSSFKTAVHSLATFKWHTLPRIQLAVIWAGIEALFGVESEITFRISLYIAKFLAGSNPVESKRLFEETKKLYKIRSTAVHGSEMKKEPSEAVEQSAELLQKLIIKCIELNALPDADALLFEK